MSDVFLGFFISLFAGIAAGIVAIFLVKGSQLVRALTVTFIASGTVFGMMAFMQWSLRLG